MNLRDGFDPFGEADRTFTLDAAPEEGSESGSWSGRIEECLDLLDEVWPPEAGPTPDAIPRELGRFRILGELGRGGFGVVFLAEDPALHRRVALKVPRAEILSGSEAWRRFLREVRAASQLNHPSFVPLLDAGAIGPIGYIISAYVPGPSLEDWLAHRGGAVPPRWAARMAASLARAIDYLHGRNILHRDLKPANVLLDAPGHSLDRGDPRTWDEVPVDAWEPRICDFGLAKLFDIEDDETRSRTACGSPPYMAPEQAESRRDRIGPATDVYGLGALLYELLTGRPPFGGESHLETLRRVVSEVPVPPRRRRDGIPIDLETICLKCLAKRPEHRYRSAAALADDLERFLDGRPIAARPTPPWERAGRWARRHPTTAALASAVLMAALAGFGGLLWHGAVLREMNAQLRQEARRAERHAREAEAQHRLADDRARLLARQMAGGQLFQAQLALSSEQFERARRLLDHTAHTFGRDPTPSFAWRYLRASAGDHIEVLDGHDGRADVLAFSPEGRRLASGDDRGRIVIRDVDGDDRRRTLPGSPGGIIRMAWSPDGTILASADREVGEIRIWDTATGRLRGRLPGTGEREPIWSLAFEAGGSRLRAIGPRRDPGVPAIRRWQIEPSSGAFPEVTPRSDDPAPCEHDRERLRRLVSLLDGDDPALPPTDARSACDCPAAPAVAFTRDRAFGVVAVGDGVFEVFRGESTAQLATIRLRPGHDRIILLTPKANRAGTMEEERPRIHRLANGLCPGWQDRAARGAPSPAVHDGWSIVSAAGPGECVLWGEATKRLSLIAPESEEERPVTSLGSLTGLQSAALAPDGMTLAVGDEDGLVRVWHRRPRSRVLALKGHAPKEAWAIAFSRDGRTIATGGDDHQVRLHDVDTGRGLGQLRGQDSLISALAFSPDGSRLASGSFDRHNPVALRGLGAEGALRILRGHDRSVRHVAFSPDGSILASCGDDDLLRLWDAKDGHPISAIAMGSVPGPSWVTFHPDGRTIAANRSEAILIVELDTGRRRTIPVAEEIGPLLFSRDGSSLLAGCRDGSIRTLDAASGEEVRTVQGHAGLVVGLALSPDGVELASAGADGTVRVWDAATGQELLCFYDCRARANAVAFHPDGTVLAAVDHSGTITIWDARPRR